MPVTYPGQQPSRIVTGDAFMGSFTPPDWLVDGIVQKGRLYACTSLTGHGKTAVWLYIACMVQLGRMVGHLDVIKGNVLYLAGENPEDLKARMHGMVGHYKFNSLDTPHVLPRAFPMTDEECDALKDEITSLGIDVTLIVGDTAASFFPADGNNANENDNVVAGAYARRLRTLTELPGNPSVVMLCHPIKHAREEDDLQPRGAGAFLNELDGNLTLWSDTIGEVTRFHWRHKIRGPDFTPLSFRLLTTPTGYLDTKGRDVITIVAELMDDAEAANQAKQAVANEDAVLKTVFQNPTWSFAQIAEHLGWTSPAGDPLKPKVQRAVKKLEKLGFLSQPRPGKPWKPNGKAETYLKDEGLI